MNYGDLGKRIAAYFIDGIILTVIYFLLALIFVPFLPYYSFDWLLYGWYGWYGPIFYGYLALCLVVGVIYYVALEGGGWHATLGKRAMGLYVGNADGSGITFSKAMLRYIGKIFSGLIFGIGYLMGLFSDKKQCLHDLMADSYVLEAVGGVVPGAVRQAGGYNSYNNVNGPKIVCMSGPLAGLSFPVTERGVVIGRDSVSCQIVLPSSQASVSRVHCFVSYNSVSGMYILSDRNSSQGTYLSDGRRIPYSQPVALSSGDSFYLATPQNTFRVC